MHDRTGWERGASGDQIIKGRKYKNLVEFARRCATCNEPFSIFVTHKIAAGEADSNSFGLKNCEAHRRQINSVPADQVETLQSSNNTMREELAGLYVRNRELFEELQQCKAKLATYELAPAMQAIGCEPVQNTSNGALPKALPWD